MTAEEMVYRCELGMDIGNLSAPGYTKKEWSVMLTESQESIIKNRLFPEGNKYKVTLEEVEKRANDFSELINHFGALTFTQTASNLPNGYFVDLPQDFFYGLGETTDIKLNEDNICYPSGIKTQVTTKPITSNYYFANRLNPFKNPNIDLVWRLKFERADVTSAISLSNLRRHELITDGTYVPIKYSLRYLRRPNPIIAYEIGETGLINNIDLSTLTGSIHCELDPQIHPEIVSRAVTIALGRLRDDKGYQISSIEDAKKE